MQQASFFINGTIRTICLPPENTYLMLKIKWGSIFKAFTPAFWATECWYAEAEGHSANFRLGNSLAEEVAGCVLGGYGIPAEVGLAALERLRQQGCFVKDNAPSFDHILKALTIPLSIEGRIVRYRFARQKSLWLSKILPIINEDQGPEDDQDFRRWLLKFPGIGPKTASWITRNWKNSNSVAILDIHILRAGKLMGLFESETPAKDYFEMERSFLSFATGLGVKTSILDSVMWSRMRSVSSFARGIPTA